MHLRVAGSLSPFLAGIDRLYLPIAHAEGQLLGRDAGSLDVMEAAGQLALRYDDAGGAAQQPFNPNGAARDVAGMCDRSGRVLGLMPHPERFIDRTQHPHWTRLPPFDEGDGLQLFRNAINFFR